MHTVNKYTFGLTKIPINVHQNMVLKCYKVIDKVLTDKNIELQSCHVRISSNSTCSDSVGML